MILEIALLVFIYMTIIFVFALIRKDNSIIDIFWGTGFIVIALYSFIRNPEIEIRRTIVTLLIILWGIRLSVHIYLRNHGKEEDFRYRKWRETWKWFILRSYLQIFMLQGLLMIIIASPVYFINFYSNGIPGIWDTLGLMIFGTGFLLEAFADYQLTAFKKDPSNHGKILTSGLWKYSRHPNYFGETLVWLGLCFYTLSIPNGWMTLISPVVITLVLRYVSGVPMLEKKYNGRPDWEAYKKATAPLIPYVHFF
jgi:steroid 5-alpha reductase family enzyme